MWNDHSSHLRGNIFNYRNRNHRQTCRMLKTYVVVIYNQRLSLNIGLGFSLTNNNTLL